MPEKSNGFGRIMTVVLTLLSLAALNSCTFSHTRKPRVSGKNIVFKKDSYIFVRADEAAGFSDTSVHIYQKTKRHIRKTLISVRNSLCT
jgi:hypothetical protein